MGQEFIIKSQTLEDKVNQLLPSQGGFQAGVDLSASTTIIPIVDLTESAEGSTLRQDLQTAISFGNITAFDVNNTTTVLINTTGFFRVFGTVSALRGTSSDIFGEFRISDGVSAKVITKYLLEAVAEDRNNVVIPFDFTVFLQAGDDLSAQSDSSVLSLIGCTRQIADINGNLINP